MDTKKIVLKALVGSKAHGLDRPDSDTDLRGVFLVPTSEILSLGYKEKATSWVEGQGEDATSYEIAHYLNLATKSNMSILEVLVSPVIESSPEGDELRALFPYVWNSTDVLNASRGYSHNQRKKFLEDKDERPWKYAVAQIRTLLLGIECLRFGTMTVDVEKQESKMPNTFSGLKEGIKDTLMSMKEGYFRNKGFVIDWAIFLEKELQAAYAANPDKKSDIEKVTQYLLKVRRNNW